jgi:hypothetical protein
VGDRPSPGSGSAAAQPGVAGRCGAADAAQRATDRSEQQAVAGGDGPQPGGDSPGSQAADAAGSPQGRSLLDDLVDYGVYAPLGAAIRVAGGLPDLVGKGVSRVGSRISMARVVGRFAVTQARRKVGDALSSPARDEDGARPADRLAGQPGQDVAGPGVPPADLDRPTGVAWVFDDDGRYRGSPVAVPAPASVPEAGNAGAPDVAVDLGAAASVTGTGGSIARNAPSDRDAGAPPATAPSGAGSDDVLPELPAVDALAIPNYDSLAASQVVPRLASLSAAELESLRRYEAAHRRRMTVLNRVAQLQDAAGSARG